MTDRDKIIETMARAYHERARFRYLMHSWERIGADSQRDFCAAMKAALTAYESHLQASGMAVVPVEPTNKMLIAALARSIAWMKENGVSGLSPFADYPSPVETTRQVYAAMLSAFNPVVQKDPDHG